MRSARAAWLPGDLPLEEITMVMGSSPLADGSSLDPAVFGLLGAVIGGVMAGGASLWVAWEARKAAESAWMRDNRRAIYDRFLTCAQMLLLACEAYKDPHRQAGEAKANLESAFTSFWEVYGVVQTVADTRLFEIARIYGYRLWELATSLGSTSVMGKEHFGAVDSLVRDARHATIVAMREELGLGRVDLVSYINPFAGTPLEAEYDRAEQSRPGRLVL